MNVNCSLNYKYNELMYKFQKVNIPYTKCGVFNKSKFTKYAEIMYFVHWTLAGTRKNIN